MRLRVLRHAKRWYMGRIYGKLKPYDPTKDNKTKWLRVPPPVDDVKAVINALRRELMK